MAIPLITPGMYQSPTLFGAISPTTADMMARSGRNIANKIEEIAQVNQAKEIMPQMGAMYDQAFADISAGNYGGGFRTMMEASALAPGNPMVARIAQQGSILGNNLMEAMVSQGLAGVKQANRYGEMEYKTAVDEYNRMKNENALDAASGKPPRHGQIQPPQTPVTAAPSAGGMPAAQGAYPEDLPTGQSTGYEPSATDELPPEVMTGQGDGETADFVANAPAQPMAQPTNDPASFRQVPVSQGGIQPTVATVNNPTPTVQATKGNAASKLRQLMQTPNVVTYVSDPQDMAVMGKIPYQINPDLRGTFINLHRDAKGGFSADVNGNPLTDTKAFDKIPAPLKKAIPELYEATQEVRLDGPASEFFSSTGGYLADNVKFTKQPNLSGKEADENYTVTTQVNGKEVPFTVWSPETETEKGGTTTPKIREENGQEYTYYTLQPATVDKSLRDAVLKGKQATEVIKQQQTMGGLAKTGEFTVQPESYSPPAPPDVFGKPVDQVAQAFGLPERQITQAYIESQGSNKKFSELAIAAQKKLNPALAQAESTAKEIADIEKKLAPAPARRGGIDNPGEAPIGAAIDAIGAAIPMLKNLGASVSEWQDSNQIDSLERKALERRLQKLKGQ